MQFNRQNDSSGQENAVRKYYDDNTKMFLKHGEHGKTYGIHQPLYLNRKDSTTIAMNAQHAMILERMHVQDEPYNVLDLGCGVGSSLKYLARHSTPNVDFTGISISPGQIELARQYLKSHPDQDRIRFMCESFQQLPEDLIDMDLAYAIESFIHSPDAKVFFQQISNCLKSNGQLLIFDDFPDQDASTKRGKRILAEFRSGWKANNLSKPERVVKMANDAGLKLKENINLTAYLKLNRPRDKAIALVAPLVRGFKTTHQYAMFLLGGNARQQGFKRGLLSYRLLVFRKTN